MKRRLPWEIVLFCCIHSVIHAANLFDESNYRSIIADKKAYLPGDLLTVIVMETSNAQSSADLASGKNIKAALDVRYDNQHHSAGVAVTGNGRTAAQTGRNGKIKASLTVRIKEVQADGRSYVVEGRQQIGINGEQQTILLSGLVRSEDISPQNTILSTRLADARITYTGDGSVSDSQRRNYIYKVMSLIGLV